VSPAQRPGDVVPQSLAIAAASGAQGGTTPAEYAGPAKGLVLCTSWTV
jgi:hypothetical protein